MRDYYEKDSHTDWSEVLTETCLTQSRDVKCKIPQDTLGRTFCIMEFIITCPHVKSLHLFL